MSESEFKKNHKKLIAKRKKYQLFSLLFRQKSLIVDFLPLEDIPQNYCSYHFFVEGEKKVKSYLPKPIGGAVVATNHIRSAISIYRLQNLLFSGNSSFFLTLKRDTIFYEKLHQDKRLIYVYNDENIQFHSDSLAKIKNLPVKKHSEDAIYFGGTFTTNYYHFVIEILSKVQFIDQIPGYKKLKIILDISIKNNENLNDIADFFLKDYDKIYVENSFYHSFENIWYITNPNPSIPNITLGEKYESEFSKLSPESITYLQQTCLNNYDESKVKVEPFPRIFIARKSNFRKYNEVELLHIAKKYGFEPIYFENLNINEQIFTMKNAEYILGSSGAAWTNLLFSKPKSKGLLWLGKVWGDFSVFSTLAKFVNFDLYVLRHENKTIDFHEDYILDVVEFEKNIIQLLEL